jgi:SAM-dependent methyltransferase
MAVERTGPQLPEWPQFSGPHLARYLFAAELARGRRVLDAGCGIGYGAVLLRVAGAASVTAVDLDAQIIAQAKERYGKTGINYCVDDCQSLSKVTGPFDLICNFENIEHLPKPTEFLATASRLLAPDGILLISTPDRDASEDSGSKPSNPYHVQEWTREEFRNLLGQVFPNVEMRVQIRTTALESRVEGVAALRKYLSWSSPLTKFIWRSFLKSDDGPAWNQLKLLATGSPADYPIVSVDAAPILGSVQFNVGICCK